MAMYQTVALLTNDLLWQLIKAYLYIFYT